MNDAGGFGVDYDPIADVLHISIADVEEPCYGNDVDGMIVILRGMMTDSMIGIEILDARRHGPEKFQKALLPVLDQEKRRIAEKSREARERIEAIGRRDMRDLVPA